MPSFTPQKSTPYIIPDGEYKIEIESAQNKVSQANNEYIAMRCRVIMPDGSQGPIIRDNLNFTTEGARRRTTAALEALGIAVIYDEPLDISADDVLGKEGRAYIKHNAETDYMDIKSWMQKKTSAPVVKPATKKTEDGDDIPF
jgi:hypothetical protein